MAGPRILAVFSLAFLCISSVQCDTEDDFEQNLRRAYDFIKSNATLQEALQDHMKLFGDDYEQMQSGSVQSPQCPTCPPKYSWPCPLLQASSPKPTSVHKLRPADIDVVGAIGDSITAANGLNAITVLGCLLNYRGESWSIGGVGDISREFTLPNILKQYNPKLKGYSTGIGNYKSHNAHLNLAVAGAKSEDMVKQAIRLIERMRQTTDFENDWKVVTLFIGGNDLCAYCKDTNYYKASYYTRKVQNALDILHENMPRTFVNVVPMLDVSQMDVMNQGLICSLLHVFVCKCGSYPKDAQAEKDLQAAVVEYQRTLTALIESGRYDTRDDFTVVLQPFFQETKVPMTSNGKPDLSYFAPDCFHFSRKGHRNAAEALWNNMVEPVGGKRTNWVPHEQVECPKTANSYFYTYKNSPPRQSVKGMLGSQQSDSLRSQGQGSQGSRPEVTSNTGLILGCLCAVLSVTVLIGIVVMIRKKKQASSEDKALLANSNVAYT